MAISISEKFFVFLILFISTGALTLLIGKEFNNSFDSITQVIWMLAYVLSIYYIFKYKKNHIKIEPTVLLILSIVFLSVFWSVSPSLSLQRFFALTGTTIFGYYLALRYNYKEILSILVKVFGFIFILSFIFILFFPTMGVETSVNVGSWRGIFVTKNTLGRYAVIGFLVMILYILQKEYYSKIGINRAYFYLMLSIILLIGSRSSTSLLIMLIIIIAIFSSRLLFINIFLRLSIVLFSTVGLIILIVLFDDKINIYEVLGKDSTLTGRTELWDLIWLQISSKYWFGYGYSAFWQSSYSGNITRFLNWGPTSAHNGILDIWLQLGIFGVFIVLLSFFKNFIISLKRLFSCKDYESFIPPIFLFIIALNNITESSFLVHNSLFWILYVYFTSKIYTCPKKHLNIEMSICNPVRFTTARKLRENYGNKEFVCIKNR